MRVVRVASVVFASLLMASGAQAVVYPYSGLGIGGPNSVYDVDLTMCTGPNGCIDIDFKYCRPGLPNSKANPNTPCVVRAVPAGWCANGTNAGNQFDAASGTCSPGVPALGTIRCGSAADCPSAGDSCVGANLAAQCTNATATAICGATAQARCSDGDPDLRIGDSGGGLCTHTIIGGGVEPTNCGKEGGVTVASATGGPRSGGFENAPSAVTPQRQPGTGLSTVGPILDLKGTGAIEFDPPDAYGVRRFRGIGNSGWGDWGYADKSVGGGPVSAMLPPHPFDAPNGWQTQDLIGVCASGSNDGTLCLGNGHCTGGGTCGNLAGPYTYASGSVGFIWTADVDPNTAPATCPPVCGLDYDWSTFESQALEGLMASDPNAGRQVAFNELTKTGSSGIARAGDAISSARVFTFVFLNADGRCYIGGDPARLPTYPAKIGICTDSSGAFCDPATELGNLGSTNTTNDCVSSILCEYCGGRHSSLSAPNGGASAFPVGYDDQAGNCAPGYDCSVLGLTGRIGGRNNISYNIKVPLTVIFTTGYARAEVRDSSCGVTGNPLTSTCLLGGASGATGIGAGGTFTVGEVFPAGGTCCAGGGNLSWAAVDNGAAIAGHNGPVGTGDFNPGPNGIPGCIGDNQNGDSAPPCSTEGGGKAPGTASPGTDDTARYAVVLESGGPTRNASSPPRVDMSNPLDTPVPNPSDEAPTLRMVAAGSVTDLDILGVDSNDSLFRVTLFSCPVRTGNGGEPDCFYDPDFDGDDDDDDNCPTVANPTQANADGDAHGDACDNCVTVSNSTQTNSDADALGDACDACTNVTNGTVVGLSFQTTTGGQLDDDADGYGQQCDADFNQAKNKIDATDLDLFKVAFNKNRNGLGPDCNPGGTAPCDVYDLDNNKAKIDATDLAIFKTLFNINKGPKCPTCPLTCVGDACP